MSDVRFIHTSDWEFNDRRSGTTGIEAKNALKAAESFIKRISPRS